MHKISMCTHAHDIDMCHRGVTGVSRWRYRGVTEVSQRCHRSVTEVPQGCQRSVTDVCVPRKLASVASIIERPVCVCCVNNRQTGRQADK
jgi:hypothetical protein